MQFATTPAALFLTIAPLLIPVSAHGFLRALDVDGKPHHGCTPGTGAGSSSAKTTVIRTIDNTNPLHLSDPKISSHLSCGRGAATRGAPHHAIVKPGSSLAFHWDAGDGSAWPHNSGPMITYIADCGTAGCTKVDSSKLKWWKLNQVGKVSTPGNSWAQGRVHKGKHYTFKLPKDMPNGHFLLGHEIIALHQADKRNGAEFYPSCSQITVTGGSRKKISGKAVTFPGAYKLTDKGLHINVRSMCNTAWQHIELTIWIWLVGLGVLGSVLFRDPFSPYSVLMRTKMRMKIAPKWWSQRRNTQLLRGMLLFRTSKPKKASITQSRPTLTGITGIIAMGGRGCLALRIRKG
ncbi:hypothetical protein FRB95_013097 [Tulasnella sp. JGI-2019a]|nr:hypothetical protein FRB95_013097 [Tulasnella sp. JGI-2019a]